MIYATHENTHEGDTVLIPIKGEELAEEQICLEYTVGSDDNGKKSFLSKVKPEDQVVGTGQEPMPAVIPFDGSTAYLNKKDERATRTS